MTREGDIIGPEDDRLEVAGVCDLVVYVPHPDDVDKKRQRMVPKVVGRVVHATKHVRGATVVEEW